MRPEDTSPWRVAIAVVLARRNADGFGIDQIAAPNGGLFWRQMR